MHLGVKKWNLDLFTHVSIPQSKLSTRFLSPPPNQSEITQFIQAAFFQKSSPGEREKDCVAYILLAVFDVNF